MVKFNNQSDFQPNQALFFRLPEVEAGFAILAVQLMGLDVVSHAERLIGKDFFAGYCIC